MVETKIMESKHILEDVLMNIDNDIDDTQLIQNANLIYVTPVYSAGVSHIFNKTLESLKKYAVEKVKNYLNSSSAKLPKNSDKYQKVYCRSLVSTLTKDCEVNVACFPKPKVKFYPFKIKREFSNTSKQEIHDKILGQIPNLGTYLHKDMETFLNVNKDTLEKIVNDNRITKDICNWFGYQKHIELTNFEAPVSRFSYNSSEPGIILNEDEYILFVPVVEFDIHANIEKKETNLINFKRGTLFRRSHVSADCETLNLSKTYKLTAYVLPFPELLRTNLNLLIDYSSESTWDSIKTMDTQKVYGKMKLVGRGEITWDVDGHILSSDSDIDFGKDSKLGKRQ